MKLRSRALLPLAVFAAWFSVVATAWGHGGIPAPQQILWRGESMLVPTPYWGLFVGAPSGEWRWICDEAINSYQQHSFAVGGDGTLYATDRMGMQVSRDAGCSWDSITGPLASQFILTIQGSPNRPRVWALASGDGGGTSLWTSDDAGRTWQQRFDLPMTWPSGLVVSSDGQIVVAGVASSDASRQMRLIASRDGGETFSTENVFHLVGGLPLNQITPLWVDPQPPNDIWVSGRVDTVTTLLQLSSGAPPKEHLRLAVNIFDMLRSPGTDQLLVATAAGLYSRVGSAAFSPLPTISTSRCLSTHGADLFACAWNFQPDQAALVRLSDAATQRTRIFQYQDTKGPQSCPATTSVGRTCPMAWNIYASQLGIELKPDTPPTGSSMGCALATGRGSQGLGALLGVGLCLLALSRRRCLPFFRQELPRL